MKLLIIVILELCLWYCLWRGIKELTELLRLDYHHNNLENADEDESRSKPKQDFGKNDGPFRILFDFLTLSFRFLREKDKKLGHLD